MLKKNKDYVEFTLQYTSVDWARSTDHPEVCLKGYSDFSFPGVPIMDVVCNEFDHKVVVVSKRDFDRLQAENEHHRELAKQREEDYKALLDKTGFYNLADLMCYLPKDKTLKDIIDVLAAENEGLIKKLQESDPFPEYKELLEKLHSKEDVEKFEWTLNHICGGKASANGWMVTAKLWRRNYETLSKLVGFSSVEEIQDYLTNEAEADTLYEGISKLHDQVKYTCDEWKDIKKKLEECEKDYISERDKAEALEKENEQLRSERTHIVYLNDPLGVIAKWEKVTGYDRPEDFLKWKANIEGIMEAWKDDTGCDTPDDVKKRIEALNERIDESEADYNHLLCITGFESEGEIEDALDKCDHSTLRKALVDYEFDYEALLKFTGYKSEHDIRVMLNGEKYQYKTMRELINSLERKVKFTEANWQKATGCDTPGRAEEKLEFYKERLGNAVQAASCAAKHLDNITF